MNSLYSNKVFKALVLWCGLWQAVHLALNVGYCFGAVEFPLPPPEGWTEQAHRIFDGIVASDMVQSVVSLLFVAGYLMRRRWSFVLGLVSLSSSMFNSFSFTFFMIGTGAWGAHFMDYTMIQVLWLPMAVLFFWLCRALARGEES